MIESLNKINFRHIFAVLICFMFLLITILPFWIGSKNLSQQAWVYLGSSQGVITVILTLAGRRYFDKTDKEKDNDINISNNPISPVSSKQCSCGQNTTSLS